MDQPGQEADGASPAGGNLAEGRELCAAGFQLGPPSGMIVLWTKGWTLMDEQPRRTVPGWDEYFLGIAQAVAARAKCVRRQVAAVIVHERRIIATGYNGAAPGRPDCLEGACPRGQLDYTQIPGLGDYDRPGTPGFCIAIHAEVNALLFATRDTKGATAYITDPPCPGCRKALAAAGIVRAVWPEGVLDQDGLVAWDL